jgi:hypothetical protein
MMSADIGHIDPKHIDTHHSTTQYSTLSAALIIKLMLRHVESCVGCYEIQHGSTCHSINVMMNGTC